MAVTGASSICNWGMKVASSTSGRVVRLVRPRFSEPSLPEVRRRASATEEIGSLATVFLAAVGGLTLLSRAVRGASKLLGVVSLLSMCKL